MFESKFSSLTLSFYFAPVFSSLIRKSQSNSENFDVGDAGDVEDVEDNDDESEEDERPDSIDDKVRQKDMRKGIDLATTLERIEKNFVITDPRLPDNPIVRISYRLYLFFS